MKCKKVSRNVEGLFHMMYRSVTGCKTPTSRKEEVPKIPSGRLTASNGPIRSTNIQ